MRHPSSFFVTLLLFSATFVASPLAYSAEPPAAPSSSFPSAPADNPAGITF